MVESVGHTVSSVNPEYILPVPQELFTVNAHQVLGIEPRMRADGEEVVVSPPFTFQQLVRGSQIRFKRHGNTSDMEHLPPRDAWLVDLDSIKIDHPLDDRGLVDPDLMIQTLQSLIDPSYEYTYHRSLDHIYYEEAWYQDLGQHAVRFRELAINKLIVPKQFENLKDHVMIPPPIPNEHTMRGRTEAWGIARRLFDTMRRTELLRQRSRTRAETVEEDLIDACEGVDEAYFKTMLYRHFSRVEKHLDDLRALPEEFRLVEPDDPHDVIIDKLYPLVGVIALYAVNRVNTPAA